MSGVTAHKAWHFCLGNAWGNRLDALVKGGYEAVLANYYDVNVDELVLDSRAAKWPTRSSRPTCRSACAPASA
jgi:hypothetical protein